MFIFLLLLMAGPRFAIVLWALIAPSQWDRAFDGFVLPLLGFIFVPWTTLMFVIVAPNGNISGSDWWILGLAFAVDLLSHAGGLFNRRVYA